MDPELEASPVVANCRMNRERELTGGNGYDARRRLVSCRGRASVDVPWVYLGADDRAGPNYTGQPAVTSVYAPGDRR